MITLTRYTPDQRTAWDAFVRAARNRLFLFERGYMDYHADRFADHSLIARADGQIVALLPAHERDGALISHQGLTFGGWIVDGWMRQTRMESLFAALAAYARGVGMRRLIYKAIPYIYHRQPTGEDLYALYVAGARLTDRRPITVTTGGAPFSNGRAYKVRKAARAGVTAAQTDDLAGYWTLLAGVLREQYAAAPVHTESEIARLATAFPDHIKLYGAYYAGALVAGVLIYENQTAARAQYIASDARGRAVGALDVLFDHLVHEVYAHKPYFEFGTSIASDGALNAGLTAHKEDFGARAVACDTYTLEWT
jgi:hypothetical protein